MMQTLRMLFGTTLRVSRTTYMMWGLALMLLKYAGEVVIYYLANGDILTPLNFLSPAVTLRYPKSSVSMAPDWFFLALILWTLPFVWIGASMSIRRAVDAGKDAWWGLLFLVPVINFGLMVFLSVVRTVDDEETQPYAARVAKTNFVLCGVFALLCGTAAVGYVVLVTNVFGGYGWMLFVGAPLSISMVQAYWLTSKARQSEKVVYATTSAAMFYAHVMLLMLGLEGFICIAMSLPIALTLSAVGTMLGIALGKPLDPTLTKPVAMMLMLPLFAFAESQLSQPHQDAVLTEVHINASPETVWQHVLSFPELAPTNDWLFSMGVAYPKSAHIVGRGVGAVRHCVFSTGTFVEPITAWTEASHLAFDVKSQPPTMRELSFYDDVNAPHLNGFFRSKHGEFRLVRQPDGTTLLQGRTWYEMDIHPGWYWQIYGRWIIHKIHTRVLDHIKGLSEA